MHSPINAISYPIIVFSGGTHLIVRVLWHESYWPASQPTNQPSSQTASQPASQPAGKIRFRVQGGLMVLVFHCSRQFIEPLFPEAPYKYVSMCTGRFLNSTSHKSKNAKSMILRISAIFHAYCGPPQPSFPADNTAAILLLFSSIFHTHISPKQNYKSTISKQKLQKRSYDIIINFRRKGIVNVHTTENYLSKTRRSEVISF